MKKKDTFLRFEKKYMMDKTQYDNFIKEVKKYMLFDEYGKHTISNIYYDTKDFKLISRSIEKPVFKEKIRLRAYGEVNQNSKVFLEIKRKVSGIVYKRRVMMTYKEAINYMNKKEKPNIKNKIFDEIEYFNKIYDLQEAVFISYDRIALFSEEDNDLRITIDSNLRSNEKNKSLINNFDSEKYFEDEKYLMEIKLIGGMPIWLSNILNQEKIYPASFSKYGNVYKKMKSKKEEKSNLKEVA